MENPIKMYDLGVPLFLETPISLVFSVVLRNRPFVDHVFPAIRHHTIPRPEIPADSPNRSMGAIARYDEEMDQLRQMELMG